MRSPAACTIISRNYLSYARILASSWQQHEPGRRFYLLVVDGLPDGTDAGPGVRVLAPEELGLSSFDEMRRKYDVTELSTAVKPSLLSLLLERYGEEAVVYFDPDILILRPLDELWEALAAASVVLTPHLVGPIPQDGRKPAELDILLAGAYNLGFVAVRGSEETRGFLAWWSERLRDGCRIDHARGMFVDQRWIDLVPGLFPSTVLLRDETYNVAYWNLHSRPLERRGDRFFVQGRPVAFFHFSGFDPETPRVLSKHQDRTAIEEGTALAELLDAYVEMQARNGLAVSRRWGYGHARPVPVPSPAAPPAEPIGVNLAGYIASEKGVGEAVRSSIRSVQAAGIPYVLNNFTDSGSANLETRFTAFSEENPLPVNLVHVNADQVPHFVAQKGEGYFRGRYNIGYWFWENSTFPEEWQPSFRCFQEIWVGSRFIQDAVSRVAPIPVVHVPLSVQEDLPRLDGGRSRFGLPPLPRFVFLFVFDFHSFLERKNPIGLIRAFRRAFRKDAAATLVLKCSHGESSPAGLAALRQAAGDADVRILDGVLSREEVNTLLSLSDCYVSLHRSEGFGLPLAEAMSLEKPVIATGYSGNMDFMTPLNSFPVDHRLIEIDEDHGPYKKGCVWADPDEDHAASLMRLVFEDRARAQEVGRRARQDVRRNLAPRVIGERIRERLMGVAAAAAPAGRKAGADGDRLLHRIRQAVRDTVEPGANVIVVSKGDDELLKLDGRQGWHFPRAAHGGYAGHHPADSREAIHQLEALRAHGGEYLLFPAASFWWLGYYDELARHLDGRYPRVWKDGSCILYKLRGIDNRVAEVEQLAASLEVRLEQVEKELAHVGHRLAVRPYISRDLFGTAGDLDRPMGYGPGADIPGFADLFRGPEDFIAERQRAYLPFFQGLDRIVDLGCGRGEFLRLLAASGGRAVGVELDSSLVERGTAQGLDVVRSDALDYLQGLPAGSLDAIFSAQFIEHLDPVRLVELLALAKSRLRSGGTFIAETVNPECFEALKTFHVDLTHQRPIYPQVLLFLCRDAGFPSARIFYPLGGGFTQAQYERVGEYAVVAVA